MTVVRREDVPKKPVTMAGASKTTIQEYITARTGAPNFALRIFELEPGGHTPFHQHQWEQENYILEGEAELVHPDGSTSRLRPGDAVLVPSMEMHQYRNVGAGVLRFVCCIPVEDKCAT